MSKNPGRTWWALASVLGALGILSACGGGDASDNAPPVAAKQVDVSPYLGTWSICDSFSATSSVRNKVVISQVGAGRFHYEQEVTDHASSDCSAAGTVVYQEQGDAVALGETVTVDGIPAQKLAVTGERDTETGRAAFSENQVVALTADGLRYGGPDDLDAGGMMHFAPEILTRPETLMQHPAPPQSPPPSVA